MANEIKLSIPENCGNSPRQQIIRDFNIASITEDRGFLFENLADSISWNIIGGKEAVGKEAFIDQLTELHSGEMKELILLDIINHGYAASANGTVIGKNHTYDFCHVYRFTGATKTAKIKEITSYIISRNE